MEKNEKGAMTPQTIFATFVAVKNDAKATVAKFSQGAIKVSGHIFSLVEDGRVDTMIENGYLHVAINDPIVVKEATRVSIPTKKTAWDPNPGCVVSLKKTYYVMHIVCN